jgi:hypothetical protein
LIEIVGILKSFEHENRGLTRDHSAILFLLSTRKAIGSFGNDETAIVMSQELEHQRKSINWSRNPSGSESSDFCKIVYLARHACLGNLFEVYSDESSIQLPQITFFIHR